MKEKNFSPLYPYPEQIIPKETEFDKAINNGDIEFLRTQEKFNHLVISIINLAKKQNKTLPQEEVENIVIQLLKKPEIPIISNQPKESTDIMDKFIRVANNEVDFHIYKRYKK